MPLPSYKMLATQFARMVRHRDGVYSPVAVAFAGFIENAGERLVSPELDKLRDVVLTIRNADDGMREARIQYLLNLIEDMCDEGGSRPAGETV